VLDEVGCAEESLAAASAALEPRAARHAETTLLSALNRATVAKKLAEIARKSVADERARLASPDCVAALADLREAEALTKLDLSRPRQQLVQIRGQVAAVQEQLDAHVEIQNAAVRRTEALKAVLGEPPLTCIHGSCVGSEGPHAEPRCDACPFRRHVSAIAELAAMPAPEPTS
jgi:hypothetical protein